MNKYMYFLLIALVGCSEDEKLDPNPVDPEIKLLRKIDYTATDYSEYDYDAQNRMVRYFHSWNNVIGNPNSVSKYEYKVTYGTGNKLASSEVHLSGTFQTKITYHYQNNQLYKTETYSPQNELLKKSYYQFNAERLVLVTDSILQAGQQDNVIKNTFTYYPDGNLKNITEQSLLHTTGEYVVTYEINYEEYDNRKNLKPFFWYDVYLPGLKIQPNNVLKIMRGTTSGPHTIFTYNYEYDEEGYPVKEIETVNGKAGAPGQITYQKK